MRVDELTTPALVVDLDRLDANIAAMAPGVAGRRGCAPTSRRSSRTALARRLARRRPPGFCCATVREMEGMAVAGLGHDLLLANEVLDATRLGALVAAGARVTMAVDSTETIDAAARRRRARGADRRQRRPAPVRLRPDDAGRLADLARAAGLEVRGVMGYEGHT